MVPRFAWASWRWMTFSGTPSRASSTAWAWRSWCGAKRRLTPAYLRSARLRAIGADQVVVGSHHRGEADDRRLLAAADIAARVVDACVIRAAPLKGAKTLFAHEIRVLAPFRLSARYRNGSTDNLRSRGQSATS